MLISDLVLVNLAFLSAYVARIELQLLRAIDPSYTTPFSGYVPLMLTQAVLLPILFRLGGGYDLRRNTTWLDRMAPIVRSTLVAVAVLIAVTFFDVAVFSRLLFGYDALLIVVYLGISRIVWGLALAQLRQRGVGVARVVIVGAGEVGRTVLRTIIARPELGYQIVGFVDDHPDRRYTDIGSFHALGPINQLSSVLDAHTIDEVIITLPWSEHPCILNIAQVCEARGVRPRIVPDLFQMSLSSVDVNDLVGIPLIGMRVPSLSGVNLVVKRAFDLIVGIPLMLIALPLAALIGLAIRIDSPGPIVFRQIRVGLNGQPFWCYKFRSMRQSAEEEVERLLDRNESSGPLFKRRDDPRRTRVGRFLRRTSLDELPQLINVLRGEMSLVGPRPPLPGEVEQYKDWHKPRLVARPGMTGLWQVSGRSDVSFDEMVLLDIYYIENWSLPMDIGILLRTLPKVLSGEGAY